LQVLVTRPAEQAEALCSLIEQAGGVAVRLPLLAAAPVANPAAAAAHLDAARDDDIWIFTSANAVRFAAALDSGRWPRTLAAAGKATAAALREAGRSAVFAPAAGDGTPGLLADPAFAAVRGRPMLIVTGESSLPDLAAGLRNRGALVEQLAVYRRVPVGQPQAAVAAALDRCDAAIVTSAEVLAQLWSQTPAASRPRLLRLQLALPSPRVVEEARKFGFERPPLLPARVSDAAFVELLLEWRRQNDAR
jgi:uroporphyrinogen-III synthase